MNERSIAEQAADWVIELTEPEAGTHAAFAQWLSESPRHVEEYLLVSTLYGALDGVDREHEMNAAILETDLQPNVVALRERATPAARDRSRRWMAIAATVLCVVVAGGGWWIAGRADVYSTAVGELRSIELSDGSVVALNTHSRLRVKYTATGRSLELLSGEALFTVANDPARPFVVRSDAAVIQALGTQFNVYQRPKDTAVAVLEGSVRIDADGSATLMPGTGATVSTDGELSAVSSVDVSRITAWRERRLVFIDDTLDTIVSEFNRYRTAPLLRIEGAQARAREFTGVFDAGDPQSLVQFLRGLNGLKVESRAREIVIRSSASE